MQCPSWASGDDSESKDPEALAVISASLNMVTLGIWVEIVSRALANFQIDWDAIDDLE